MSSNVSAPAGPHCRNCGARIDPQVARVVGGNDGNVPVCGTGDCGKALSHSGVEFDSTVRAVTAYHHRRTGE